MYSIEFLQNKIKQALLSQNFNLNPPQLYNPISYTISFGGKRMRPVLVLMACNLFKENIEKAVLPALGIEMFHNFTLIHDDIMDNAPLRRGKKTVYKKWDTNIAILSGDTMFALSYKYLINTEKKVLAQVLKIFNQAAVNVCEGQQYDMNFETTNNVSVKNYIEMIRLKTAVLLAASLKIGAVIGGANKQDADNIYKFGESIGLAFQLKDDLLDTFGNQKKFGKKIGGDIISNKKTYLYIKAFELAKNKTLNDLDNCFNNKSIAHNTKIKTVIDIYNKLKIKDITEKKIEYFCARGLEYLNQIKVKDQRKKELKSFTKKLMIRNF
jgi:geranylgeranyl diphosphate synthase type II